MTVGKFMRRIDTGEKSSSEQSASRSGDGNFSRAFLIVILRAVHARAHGIFFHQAGIERLETINDAPGIRNTRIKPEFVVLRP